MTDTESRQICILGARGMLGSDLVPALRATGHTVHAYDLPECDVTDIRHLRAAIDGMDVVINCAAYTNVDGAESERETAEAVNTVAPGLIGKVAADAGAYVIHISTDFVFDGKLDRPYREDDAPAPLNAYGATKLEGERALMGTDARKAIVRVQWTYGEHGRHFVSKLLERAAGSGDLMMVDDQLGSPTWTRDVARALCHVVELQPEGLFHYAADGCATRFEVARFVLDLCGFKDKSLKPCKTADFNSPARRPLNSRFDCAKIEAVLRTPRPTWKAALAEFLAKSTPSG